MSWRSDCSHEVIHFSCNAYNRYVKIRIKSFVSTTYNQATEDHLMKEKHPHSCFPFSKIEFVPTTMVNK